MTIATKSQKGAATRDQILDAAARLIHLQGYHCTSLDDVLRESGVGKGNFYYYFKSKEDLGYAIIDRVTRGFIERTLEPVFGDPWGDPVAQFLLAALERAILLTKVTKDIGIMERCVEQLKQHLTLYTINAESIQIPGAPDPPARGRTT